MPKIFEHLLGARLDALAARAAERLVQLFDEPEGDAAAREVDRQRQAGRAGAANQNVGCEMLRHRHLHMCTMHIIGEWRGVKKEGAKYTYRAEGSRASGR